MADPIIPPAGYSLDSTAPAASAITPPAGYTLDTPAKTWLDHVAESPVGRFMKSAWGNLADTGQAMVTAATTRPDKTIKAVGLAQDQQRVAAEDAFRRGDFAAGVQHVLGYIVPIAGPAIDATAEQARQGHIAESLGGATVLGAQLAAPEVIRMNAPLPAPVPAGVPTGVAQRLYQGALNPRINTPLAEVRSMVAAGLENAIPVSESGATKLNKLLTDLNQQIDTKVQPAAARGVSIDPRAVSTRLNDVEKRFAWQVAPDEDLRAIDKIGDQFTRNNSTPMAADEAQQMKVGTYQRLQEQYGRVSEAKIEAQKALARGIKEELLSQIPELADLNGRESKLFDLQGPLEQAVAKAVNRQGRSILPSGPLVTGALATTASGSTPIGIAAGLLKAIVSDPAIASRLAITINRAQGLNPVRWGRPSMAAATARVNQFMSGLDQAVQPQNVAEQQ